VQNQQLLKTDCMHFSMAARDRPEGYFYAAQDADSFTNPAESEPEEGAFYVWSYSELERCLPS